MRASTPPLYQRPPDGAPPAFHTGAPPAAHDAAALRLGQLSGLAGFPTQQLHAAPGEFVTAPAAPRFGSLEVSGRLTRPAHYATQFPTVPAPNSTGHVSASPRSSAAANEVLSSDLFRYGTALTRNTMHTTTTELAALEEEEASLKREEEELRPQIMELERMKDRLEEETQKVAVELMQMVVLEQQYYVEPVVDYSSQISSSEMKCANLANRVEEAKRSFEELLRQHQSYDAIIEEKEKLKKEMSSVQGMFSALENRRRLCMIQSEALFDVESRRAEKATNYAEEIEGQLMEIRGHEPLLAVRQPRRSPRSTSCGISFAQKSFVLDAGSDEGDDDCDRNSGDTLSGLTQRGSWNYGNPDEERENEEGDECDDIFGVAGQSVRYSLNGHKRVRLALPAMGH